MSHEINVVLMVNIHNVIFSVRTQRNLNFRGIYFHHILMMKDSFKSVRKHLPDYTISCHRRLQMEKLGEYEVMKLVLLYQSTSTESGNSVIATRLYQNVGCIILLKFMLA
jgi:hypothetical protein